MGYSVTKHSIERVQPFLDQLAVGTTNLEWASDNPSRLAYYIREGIRAAAKYAYQDGSPVEPYNSYAQISSKYIIRSSNTRIIADLRVSIPSEVLKSAQSTMNIRGVTNVLEIIGAAIKHKASTMIFPDATGLSDDNLVKLYNWTNQNNYYMVVGDVITLTRDDPGISWKPSDLNE